MYNIRNKYNLHVVIFLNSFTIYVKKSIYNSLAKHIIMMNQL